MPGAAFHSFYWQTQAAEPPPDTGGAGQPGYAAWQTSITVGMFLLLLFQG